MAWIESHTVLIRHKKLILMAKELRLKPVYLLGHLHALWHTALEQQEDGDLSSWSDDLIADYSAYLGDSFQYVSLLQRFGWLDGKLLHDWMDYAGRYLESKYRTARPDYLESIRKKHENNIKSDFSQTTVNPPNLTNPPNQPKEPAFPFEDLWDKYPNKDGRIAAVRSFKASVKTDQDWTDINIALSNYLESERVRKGFIKNGSTWFANWRDWIKKKTIKPKPKEEPQIILKPDPKQQQKVSDLIQQTIRSGEFDVSQERI